MNFLLTLCLISASPAGTISLTVGAASSTQAWVTPNIVVGPGEAYSVSVDWSDGMNYGWANDGAPEYHQYLPGTTHTIYMAVARWWANGQPRPVVIIQRTVAMPRTLTLSLSTKPPTVKGGNGSIAVTIGGGVAPYTLSVNGSTMQIGGSLSLLKPPGGYMVTVTGCSVLPGNAHWQTTDSAGASVNVPAK